MLSVNHLTGFGAGGGRDLLAGETDGLAVDFTNPADFARHTWAMQAVQERNSSVDTLQSPHVFFTNSGTSAKYVKNSATTIGWSPHNLFTHSQAINSWGNKVDVTVTDNATTAPDGTSTASRVLEGSAGTALIDTHGGSGVTTAANAVYTLSWYMKSNGTGQWFRVITTDASSTSSVRVWVDLTNGVLGSNSVGTGATYVSSSITSAGNGWYYITLTGSNDDTTTKANVLSATADGGTTRVSGADYFIWGVQLNRGYSATAYMATAGAAKIGLPISYGEGLLVEPAATNLTLRSQEFDNAAWSEDGIETVTAGSVTAPDGTATADTLEATATNADHIQFTTNTHTISSDTNYTVSFYVKEGTHRYVSIALQANSSEEHAVAVFDLQGVTGAATETDVGTTSGTVVSTSQTAVGNGWYRLTLTASVTHTTAYTWIGFANAATGNTFDSNGHVTVNATGDETIHVWGAQLELGTVATSYIPTVAATVTRAADVISALTSAIGSFSATAGNLNVSFVSRLINHTTADRIVELNDGTNNEAITLNLVVGDSPDSMGIAVVDGGVAQAASTVTKAGSLSLSGNKVSGSWEVDDFAFLADGGAEVTDTSGSLPTVTAMNVGSLSTTTREINGFIKALIYLPTARTQAQMQAKQALLP